MKWRTSAAMLAVLASCQGAPPKQPATGAMTARDLMTTGDGQYSRGEYDSARVVYLRAVETAGSNADTLAQARALTQAGLAAWRRGDYAESRRLGERALALKLAAGLVNDL